MSLCLNTAEFVYIGTYYQQGFGTAMGSPVSAAVSLVMEDEEQRALASLPIQRYVDDVISAVSVNKVEHLIASITFDFYPIHL